ncbi:MAG: helix-turn-helix transcriptional regulator [Christensenellales bacterium]|jgi:putative transcriptional regulator
MDSKGIGRRLRALRGDISPEKAAEDLHIGINSLIQYEKGGRIPRDEVKIRIARYYRTTAAKIFYPEMSLNVTSQEGENEKGWRE